MTAPRKKRCESHPALKIPHEGKTYEVFGGSCTRMTNHDDYDVIVGLDHGMRRSEKMFPWEPGVQFLYPISDGCAPKDTEEFYRLIAFLIEEIKEGQRVFIGCIGGHGRTGMVLAALYSQMSGVHDCIPTIRKEYCAKAVETQQQMNYLNRHFGVKKATPSRQTVGAESFTGFVTPGVYKPSDIDTGLKPRVYQNVRSALCVFGD